MGSCWCSRGFQNRSRYTIRYHAHETQLQGNRPITVKALLFLLCFAGTVLAGESTLLWRDPGPIESLDLSAGPGGRQNAPTAPFTFVKEEKHGTAPKIVVTDGRGKKWMVKFGDEAKAETFASRIAWAAGYPVRASYYVGSGQIANAPAGGRTRGGDGR